MCARVFRHWFIFPRRGQWPRLCLVALLLVGVSVGSARTQTASLADFQFGPGWATFGLALPRGAATSGVSVGSLPTQTDVKTVWPDGSIRFAIVTAKIGTAGTYAITAAGPSSDPLLTPTWPAASVAFTIGGITYTASLPAFTGASTWLGAGALVREARAVVEPRSNTAAHPLLQVLFDVRSYAGGGHRVDVTVQNARDIATANAVTYDVTVSVGGATVYSKSGQTQNFGTRWRKTFLTDGLVEADVTPDLAPFYASQALPTYLPSVASKTYVSDGPAYDILQFGDMFASMSTGGAHAELGPYPNWTAQYLVWKTRNQRAHVLANGNLAGSWSGYIMEPDGVSLLRLDRHPDYWLDPRSPSPNGPANGSAGVGPRVETPHVPSLSYVPYVLTGDRYYLDTLKGWANTILLQTYPYAVFSFGSDTSVDFRRQGAMGLLSPYASEPRGFGWGLRELVDAAVATPDSDGDKAYFTTRVQNNLDWLEHYAGRPGGGFLNPPFWEADQGTLHGGYFSASMWQTSYLTWAVDHAGLHGFGPTAAFRARVVNTMIKLLTGAPALPPEYGASVYYPRFGTFVNGIHTPFATLQEFFNANYTGPADSLDFPSPTIPRGPGPILGYYGSDYRLLLLMGVRDGLPGADTALNWLMNYRRDGQGVLDDINSRSGFAIAPFVGGGGGGTPSPPDTEAPSVPTGLAATVVVSQVNLSWTASTDNTGVTAYKVYRNGALSGTSASPSYSDAGLAPSTTFTYTVAALDGAGNESGQSAPATATTGTFALPAVSFVRSDTTTQGTWRGVFGSQGYSIANDTTSLPGYAQVTMSGQSAWTWLPATTDNRALQRGSLSGRIAAAWYSYSPFTTEVRLTDGATHQVALYSVDWDNLGRTERIDVLNGDTGTVVDTRTITGFSGGIYLVWNITGHVVLRVTSTGPGNGVVNGLFFDSGMPNIAPAVSLTAPAAGASVASGIAITVSATANDSDGSVTSVAFLANGTPIGTDGTSPYSISWTPSAAGSYSLTAIATDNQGAATTSAAIAITVTPPPPNSPPSVSLTTPAGGAAVAAGTAITVSATANDSDGSITSVAFFANGTPIGTDGTSPYSISWTPSVAGSYSLTAVATDNQGAATTSVAIAITVKPPPPNSPPLVSLTTPANGASVAAGTAITVSATANDSDGSVTSVAFFANGTPIGTDGTSPYSISWTPSAAGSYSLTAVATDNQGAATTSAAVAMTVTGGVVNTATFSRSDVVTKGTWRGVFGSQGYSMANDATSLPGYAQVAITGQNAWTWVGATTDVRALQRGSVSGRQAATWYGYSPFTIDVRLTDGTAHQVSLYSVDWDNVGRSQRIDVLNGDTGAVLDTRTLTGFPGGVYLVWNVSGHVTFRVTNAGLGNAVVSGLFVD